MSIGFEGQPWPLHFFRPVFTLAVFLFFLRYKIRGDDEEWDQVLKKAGSTAIVSIKR